MRAIFGLAGLLIVLGVIVWIMGHKGGELDSAQSAIQAGNKARDQVNQIAGNDPDTGERANRSVVLDPMMTGNKLTGFLVARVTPGGAYERYFGLARNDTIVAAEYQGARMEMRTSNDEEMAKAWVDEAYRRQGAIYVVRSGKELKLPAAAPAGAAQKKDSLQQQLDAIQSVPR